MSLNSCRATKMQCTPSSEQREVEGEIEEEEVDKRKINNMRLYSDGLERQAVSSSLGARTVT